jgi:hypothetical protein
MIRRNTALEYEGRPWLYSLVFFRACQNAFRWFHSPRFACRAPAPGSCLHRGRSASWVVGSATLAPGTSRTRRRAGRTAKELRRLDHLGKLRRGLVGFSFDHGPSISEQALRRDYSQAWKKALERNVAAIQALHKKVPAALHDARTTAQYPELNEAGCSWRSSADVSAATARNTLRQTGENLYLLLCFKPFA